MKDLKEMTTAEKKELAYQLICSSVENEELFKILNGVWNAMMDLTQETGRKEYEEAADKMSRVARPILNNLLFERK